MNIEISRWGDPGSKNAQFVVQPYHVPANTVRFMTPAGTATFVLNWEPGRASFQTVRGKSDVVAEHVFHVRDSGSGQRIGAHELVCVQQPDLPSPAWDGGDH